MEKQAVIFGFVVVICMVITQCRIRNNMERNGGELGIHMHIDSDEDDDEDENKKY